MPKFSPSLADNRRPANLGAFLAQLQGGGQQPQQGSSMPQTIPMQQQQAPSPGMPNAGGFPGSPPMGGIFGRSPMKRPEAAPQPMGQPGEEGGGAKKLGFFKRPGTKNALRTIAGILGDTML